MAARVVLVDIPSALALLRRILAGYELSHASTLRAAKQQLERDDIDLIVVGIHFDESRALEFVKAAREHKHHKETAIVLFRSFPSDLVDFLRNCIRDVSKLYRISAYVETDQYDSNQAIRTAIEAALPANIRTPLVTAKAGAVRHKILLAASLKPHLILQHILHEDEHELIHAASFDDAHRLLDEETFDGIICTILFDDGRIFDLLRLVKANSKCKDIPFVAARVSPGVLDTKEAIEGIKLACKTNGATAFVDIADFDDQSKMRQAIDQHLSGNGNGNGNGKAH